MTPGNASIGPTTAAQVLDAPEPPAKTQAAGASKSPASPSAPEVKAPEADPKIAGKLQLVIQREAAAVRREQLAAAKEAAAVARETALAAREAKMQEFESIKATNPRKALELLGMSYQDLTQVELQDGEVPADIKVQRLEDKLNQSLAAREDEKRQQAEDARKQEERRHAQTIEEFKEGIRSHTKANPGRYEFIEFEGEHDLVYDTINEHYNRTYKASVEKKAGLEKTESIEDAMRLAQEAGVDISDCRGEIMTAAQGADKVEEYLEKKYLRARELAKVKALSSQRTVTFKTADKPQAKTSQAPKTLTNDHSATPAPIRRPKTDQEYVEAAIAYARGLRS